MTILHYFLRLWVYAPLQHAQITYTIVMIYSGVFFSIALGDVLGANLLEFR